MIDKDYRAPLKTCFGIQEKLKPNTGFQRSHLWRRIMLKRFLFFCIACLIVLPVFAGDISTFVNLGFSPDSKYFMFGFYGIEQKEFYPYSSLYVVDVRKNEFTVNGEFSEIYEKQIQPGQTGLGALLTLLDDTASETDRYNIDHLVLGRPLYILFNGVEPKDKLEFRDFSKGNHLLIHLIQQQFGSGEEISSSFHINLTVTQKDGTTDTFTIGLPNYKRDGVKRYRIRQVLLSPDENGLVFVVEREEIGKDGDNIRFMVETVYLN